MSQPYPVTEEQINAYIDNELDVVQRSEVMVAIEADAALANRVSRMRQDMDLLALAFEDPPLPNDIVQFNSTARWCIGRGVAASLCLILIGAWFGWAVLPPGDGSVSDHFLEVSSLNIDALPDSPVLLHISQMNADKIDAALSRAEELLEARKKNAKPMQLEVVANAEGLGLLREGSPYKTRIQALTARYDNVSFKACGIAMENARLKEGAEVILLPEAEKIPAALGRILQRVQQGWTYVKG